jgi:hypothetical protein
MAYSKLLTTLLFSLVSVNTLADGFTCRSISGTIQPLVLDGNCIILQSQTNHFPDLTFLASLGIANSCFTAQLQGTWGPLAFSGTAFSGLTANSVGQLTAASRIQTNIGGSLYTTDVVFNSQDPTQTNELLSFVSGSRLFKGSHGNMTITGNALVMATTFSGTLCSEN